MSEPSFDPLASAAAGPPGDPTTLPLDPVDELKAAIPPAFEPVVAWFEAKLEPLEKLAEELGQLKGRLEEVGIGSSPADTHALAQHALACVRALAGAVQRAVGIDTTAIMPPAPGVAPASNDVSVVGAETVGNQP